MNLDKNQPFNQGIYNKLITFDYFERISVTPVHSIGAINFLENPCEKILFQKIH